jgi:hypothetical protein
MKPRSLDRRRFGGQAPVQCEVGRRRARSSAAKVHAAAPQRETRRVDHARLTNLKRMGTHPNSLQADTVQDNQQACEQHKNERTSSILVASAAQREPQQASAKAHRVEVCSLQSGLKNKKTERWLRRFGCPTSVARCASIQAGELQRRGRGRGFVCGGGQCGSRRAAPARRTERWLRRFGCPTSVAGRASIQTEVSTNLLAAGVVCGGRRSGRGQSFGARAPALQEPRVIRGSAGASVLIRRGLSWKSWRIGQAGELQRGRSSGFVCVRGPADGAPLLRAAAALRCLKGRGIGRGRYRDAK